MSVTRPTAGPDPSTFDGAWQILIQSGVPIGVARCRREVPPLELLAKAVLRIGEAAARLSFLERECLHAFLRGWRQHWRSSFDEHLGAAGPALIAALDSPDLDAGRSLKLKRIAVSHLARAL